MNSADLAQTVMKLTLQVEELNASLEALKQKHKHTLDLMKQQKDQEETTIKRNQKFIDQVGSYTLFTCPVWKSQNILTDLHISCPMKPKKVFLISNPFVVSI